MLTKKVVIIALVGLIMFTQQASAGVADMFDSDSDFMRGFETGLFLRTKGGSVDEYNCKIPNDSNPEAKKAFDLIKNSINTGMRALPPDPIIKDAIKMLVDFLDGLYYMFQVLSKEGRQHLDNYCTGMIFGLQGSKMLVKIANTIINPMDELGNILPGTFDVDELKQRLEDGKADMAEKTKGFAENLAKTVLKNYVPNNEL